MLKNQKFEILLKPFEKKTEKLEKKTENAVDDLQVFPMNKQNPITGKSNTQPGKDYNTYYVNKDLNRSKIMSNVQLNDKNTKRIGGNRNTNHINIFIFRWFSSIISS